MSFLPIVHRELREAARRKSTYRLRWWTALLALAGILVAFALFGLGGGLSGMGGELFSVLTGYAFGLSLLAGVILTADAVSEERRQGTLGLVFLTDLRGYDVVLGKFIARSLNAFYGLLALLPLLALPVMLGGLTGGEFWRMALVLANALVFSLALGLCVSTFGEDSQRSLRNAFGWLVLLAGVLPAAAQFAARAGGTSAWLRLAFLSPSLPFLLARDSLYRAHSSEFWLALIGSQVTAWSFLALASWALPRLWRREPIASARPGFWRRLAGCCPARLPGAGASKSASARARDQGRRLLARNPILWLLRQQAGLRGAVWLVLMGWAAIVLLDTWYERDPVSGLLFWPAKVCGFLLKMIVAFEACRFFAHARRDGTLELLLCTPLRNREILDGQWFALKRLVFLPVLVGILLTFVPFAAFAAGEFAQSGGLDAATHVAGRLATTVLGIGWFTTGLLVDFYAVAWVGMWLALSSKQPGLAAARTIFFVLVLPSVGFCGLDLLADLLLILWSSSRLHEDFRWVMARQYQPPARRLSTLQPAPPPAPAL